MSPRVHWLCNRPHPNASPGDQRPAALRVLHALDTRFKTGTIAPSARSPPQRQRSLHTPLLADLAAPETQIAIFIAGPRARGRARPTIGSDLGSLCSHDLTLFVGRLTRHLSAATLCPSRRRINGMERRCSDSRQCHMRRPWIACVTFGCGAGGRAGRPRQSATRSLRAERLTPPTAPPAPPPAGAPSARRRPEGPADSRICAGCV